LTFVSAIIPIPSDTSGQIYIIKHTKIKIHRGFAMLEVRFHGRGGQGAVTSARILAIAADKEGKHSQAFPAFGPERRGAPVQAFTRIDNRPITLRSLVYEPDYIIVLDPSLLRCVDVGVGLKKGGNSRIFVNGERTCLAGVDERKTDCLDVTGLAMKIIGKPIVNTAMLAMLAQRTGIVSLRSLEAAIMEAMPGKIGEKNAELARNVYEAMGGKR
jgi:2-oxoacid:acceptor oxidoreductase gamma subunit (pyruvate/2-ketoisovalerate family)